VGVYVVCIGNAWRNFNHLDIDSGTLANIRVPYCMA
jgi:hypothetical protein